MGQSNFYDPNKGASSIAGIQGSTGGLKGGEGLLREANRELSGGYGFAEKVSSFPDDGFAARTHMMLMSSFKPQQLQPEPV